MLPIQGHVVANFAQKLCKDNLTSGKTLLVADTCTVSEKPAICVTQLDEAFLQTAEPELVVTPLVSSKFDAIDVAQALYCAGFDGELVVMCGPLPQPQVVESELRSVAPGLRLTLSVPSKAAAAH